jgi:transposase
MDRPQAEKIYEAGKETTVETLLELDTENKCLKEKLAQFEKNSQDSSKPPSSDGPQNGRRHPKVPNTPSGRKAGGQKGHPGVRRALVDLAQVDEIKHYYASNCKKCNKPLIPDATANTTGDILRWQVVDIEPIKPKIIEHQAHTTVCECGCKTKAQIPNEVLTSNYGEHLIALIAYLTAVLKVPRRGVQEFCVTFLNLSISLGSVQKLLEYTSDALEKTVTELKDQLPRKQLLNADETGWRDRWLWIFVNSAFIYFHVAHSRGSQVLRDVLGEAYNGILCVDRWGAYTKYHHGMIQFCWAHLKRDFAGTLKIARKLKSTDGVLFAKTIERLRSRLMAQWYRYKNGKISRTELIEKNEPIIELFRSCFSRYEHSPEKYVRKLSKNLLKHFDKLFVFIYHDSVEPTNNIAERGIRPAVQWRKLCFGNRSDNGARLTARLLTVTRTCWLQNKNPLEFLGITIKAYRYKNSTPSLVL